VAGSECQLVQRLESEWRDALCKKDMSALEKLVHHDFALIGTRATGPFRMNRGEWLDAIQRRDVEDIGIDVQDASLFGETIIATVRASWRLKYLGRIIEDCVVLTDVWVKTGEQWQCVRRHSTPAPAGACVDLKGE
jgi:ketosteroid isomerase-like protein